MGEYPHTLQEFEERFQTEAACRDYLLQQRWPDGFACPRCGSRQAWSTQRGLLRCAECDYQASATAGTIFQDSHLPLRTWFRAMWWVTSQKNGASALGLQRILGLGSYRTAWALLHKLRRAMVRPGREQLAGCVEVDETYVGEEEGVRAQSHWDASPSAAVGQLAWAVFSSGVVTLLPDNLRDLTTGVRTKVLVKKSRVCPYQRQS